MLKSQKIAIIAGGCWLLLFILSQNTAAQTGAAPDGEWAAAMRYFSGSTNVKFRFYGDNVLAIAEQYESDLKDLARSD